MGCVRRLSGCTQAENWRKSSAVAKSERRIYQTSYRRCRLNSSQATSQSDISGDTPSQSLGDNTLPKTEGASGTRCTESGKNEGLDYRRLVEKYLMRDEPSFVQRDEKIEQMYKVLNSLDTSKITIFLMVVEIGSLSEVARRLKVHRKTLTRMYYKIKEKLRDAIERCRDIG